MNFDQYLPGDFDLHKLQSFEPNTVMDLVIFAQIFTGLLFLLFSLFVSHTSNVGFNIVLVACIFLGFPIQAYLSINRYKSPLTVGATLGAGVFTAALGLMTSIFWGQLSLCTKIHEQISHYSCGSKVLYRFVCILAVFMFLFQVTLTSLLGYYTSIVLKDLGEYDIIDEYGYGRAPTFDPDNVIDNDFDVPESRILSPSSVPPSADL